ncbi:WASH complex subunit 3 isoform X2 [Nematostella vectensis]|uniref:WASH complex subunit 3 isoform X2 n=1 Tax=Nematostella vectensis TaxID=45351 RepID=UPI00138FB9A2|nr:WASH complex subunit 3 isoform X2 [Nematostella vectensis]
MDTDDGFRIVPNVDYTKVSPLNHKRTLAFLNHFITHTVRFLNRFSCVCEEKLSMLSGRIQKIEIMMSILEAKLASIPGLEDVTAPTTTTAIPSATSANQQPAQQPQAEQPAATPPPATPAAPTSAPSEPEPAMTVSQDPRYAKYFQMVKVGVPPGALRGKMVAEGLDPNLLDNPDALLPGGGPPPPQADSDDELSSASSFSDDE